MENLQAIDVETGFGSIKVVGDDVTDCKIKADISAQAPTDEEAKQLANVRDAGVILYSTSRRPEQTIFSTTEAAPAEFDLNLGTPSLHEIMDLSRPRFYYMWLGY